MGKKSESWIKLYRQITETEIWKSDEPFSSRDAWIDMILMAAGTDHDVVSGMTAVRVNRGTFISSYRKLSERWHWDCKKVIRYIKLLKSLEMIDFSGTRTGTLFSIVNYGKFQDRRYTTGDTTGDTTGYTTGQQQKNIKNIQKDRKRPPTPAEAMDAMMEHIRELEEKERQEAQNEQNGGG